MCLMIRNLNPIDLGSKATNVPFILCTFFHANVKDLHLKWSLIDLPLPLFLSHYLTLVDEQKSRKERERDRIKCIRMLERNDSFLSWSNLPLLQHFVQSLGLGLDGFVHCINCIYCWSLLLPVAVDRLHVGDLHAVGWGEGPWALVTQVKAIRWTWGLRGTVFTAITRVGVLLCKLHAVLAPLPYLYLF